MGATTVINIDMESEINSKIHSAKRRDCLVRTSTSYPAQAKIHQSLRNRDERRTITHAHGHAATTSDSLLGAGRRMNLMQLSCTTSRGLFCFPTKEL
jgi:hypothetical protein